MCYVEPQTKCRPIIAVNLIEIFNFPPSSFLLPCSAIHDCLSAPSIISSTIVCMEYMNEWVATVRMRVQYGQLRDAVKIKEGKNNFRAWTTLDGGGFKR